MIRRSAPCASCVIESASSRMMILYGGHGYSFPSDATACARGVWRAKFLILSRTMEMPRSSDAFNSSTRFRKLSGLKKKEMRLIESVQSRVAQTQRAVVKAPEWWTSSRCQVGRRKACAGATKAESKDNSMRLRARTLVDVRVFRRTATVCSWAETSSMVFGLLHENEQETRQNRAYNVLLLHPRL